MLWICTITRANAELILKELLPRKQQQQQHSEGSEVIIKFDQPATAFEAMFHLVYRGVHSEGGSLDFSHDGLESVDCTR